MNSDEIASLVRKVLIVILTGLATKYHIDNNTLVAFVTDAVNLGVIVWGVVAHWNMKKVPETDVVVKMPSQMPNAAN